ncbi:MAG: DNA polymerase III subunit delta' [Dehalococcoidia bacterium]|nr:DNA polymerase III subunit delta' [Dehalococcoidia bacterium]
MIGQPKAVALLENEVATGQVPHAKLFVGPSGIGKLSLALNLAQALNCNAKETPCGRCSSCQRIMANTYADVQVIKIPETGTSREQREPKTKIGTRQIEDMQKLASTPPYEGKYKVFIIDGAEQFSAEAANHLLKTLEEPPPRVVIILLTAKEKEVLPTLISRCQRLELYPLPIDKTKEILVKQHNIQPQRAGLLASLSRGCIGWALSAVSDDKLLQKRTQAIETFTELTHSNRERLLAYAGQLAREFTKNRMTVDAVLSLWLGWWRDLLLIKGNRKTLITNIDQETILLRQAESYTTKQIGDYIRSIQTARRQLRQNANARLVLEVLMLNLPTARTPVKSQNGY